MAERLDRIRLSWVAFGWFIAASITALVLLALAASGLVADDPTTEGVRVALAFVVGFTLAGVIVGMRVADAPALHGLGIGLFSVVAWFGANLLFGEATGQTAWSALPGETVAGMLVLQAAAAVVGARMGVRWSRTPLEEMEA